MRSKVYLKVDLSRLNVTSRVSGGAGWREAGECRHAAHLVPVDDETHTLPTRRARGLVGPLTGFLEKA